MSSGSSGAGPEPAVGPLPPVVPVAEPPVPVAEPPVPVAEPPVPVVLLPPAPGTLLPPAAGPGPVPAACADEPPVPVELLPPAPGAEPAVPPPGFVVLSELQAAALSTKPKLVRSPRLEIEKSLVIVQKP